MVVIYLLFLVVGTFLLKYTKYGRHVFAIGGNKRAALVSGVNVKMTEFLVYVISGFCAAFAGLYFPHVFRLGSQQVVKDMNWMRSQQQLSVVQVFPVVKVVCLVHS